MAIEAVGRPNVGRHTSFRSPPSLWLRQHVSVPGSESFRPATRYFKWSLGRSVVIALRWNIGRLFLAAAYSSTTTSATLTISFSSSAASSHPTLVGIVAEPAHPPKNTTHRLRHPPATFFFPPLFYCFFPSPLPSPDSRLIIRNSRLMSRVLSTPTQLIVNYPWMSYAHPTLIFKLSKKNGKVSINPRSFARHRRTSRIGMGLRKNYEDFFWLEMVEDWWRWVIIGKSWGKGISGEKQDI